MKKLVFTNLQLERAEHCKAIGVAPVLSIGLGNDIEALLALLKLEVQTELTCAPEESDSWSSSFHFGSDSESWPSYVMTMPLDDIRVKTCQEYFCPGRCTWRHGQLFRNHLFSHK